MRRLVLLCVVLAVAATAAPVFALNSGTDLIVPAAGRGAPWGTDMYVANPGDGTVTGTIYWLVRGQTNPNPVSVTFSLEPGETAIYQDVIFNDFGLDSANGAFRVTADAPVIVNTRIFASDGSSTFGQGFEGIPTGAATSAGSSATVVGLSYTSVFRTNIYATAGPDGATATLRLMAPDGSMLASTTVELGVFEPYLQRVDRVFSSIGNFDDATLVVQVDAGSAIFGASKVDNATTDPTTLESDVTGGGAASVDGTYQISIYDSALFAAGGNIVIADGIVEEINGTYFNWDKLDGDDPACTLQFLWGISLSATPLADFASGVTFSDSYTSTGSGVMEWTVSFTVENNMSITGTISAVGSEFTRDDELGCNGDFPPLVIEGGKVE